MKKILISKLFLLFCAGLLFNPAILVRTAGAEGTSSKKIVVIVSANSPLPKSLEEKIIKDIFLGNKKSENKAKLLPVNQKDDKIFAAFLSKYTGMSQAAYKNYLVKKIFAEGWSAPKVIEKSDDVIKFVSGNSGAIGYVWEDELPGEEKDIRVVSGK